MPTKLISKTLLGAVSAAMLAAPAFAGGNCGGGNCAVPVKVMPSYAPQFGPMTIRNENPLGHLRSVNFQRAPNVSITRVHGLAPTAGLSDAPSGFTGGCHPSSTTYCRQDAGRPVQIELSAPAPVYSAPAPVYSAPVAPRTVHVGGGYDESKFIPRTYGDASLVPGIAYLPTSKVIRDPAAAQQVLDSGQTRPQDVVVPGTGIAPNLGMVRHNELRVQNTGFQNTGVQNNVMYQAGPIFSTTQNAGPQFAPQQYSAPQFSGQYSGQYSGQQLRAPGLTNSQGLSLAPTRGGPSFGQPSTPVIAQSGPFAGSYGSNVAPDGTYWEKTSGPTAFGDTIATSVICKRQLPRQTVNPVVGVPVPVPVAVPGCQEPGHGHAVSRYGQNAPGRWVQ